MQPVRALELPGQTRCLVSVGSSSVDVAVHRIAGCFLLLAAGICGTRAKTSPTPLPVRVAGLQKVDAGPSYPISARTCAKIGRRRVAHRQQSSGPWTPLF